MKARFTRWLPMMLGVSSFWASCSDTTDALLLDSGSDGGAPGTTLDSGEAPGDGDGDSPTLDAGSDAGDAPQGSVDAGHDAGKGDAQVQHDAGPDAQVEVDAASDAEAAVDGSTDAGDTGDAAGNPHDTDGDGFSNLFEMACETDPADGQSKPAIDTLRGEGTAQEPFVLCLPDHFDLLAAHPDVATAHANVTWDLDFDQRVPPLPLGTSLVPFTGTLSGHGHTLKNLDFAASLQVQVGLIEELGEGGVVEDLEIEAMHGAAGAVLVGVNAGTIRNVLASADTTGDHHIGILVNVNLATGSIVNCHTSGNMNALRSWVGGLVGENLGRVSDSSSSAQVQGENRTGGLVGGSSGVVERSFATGATSGLRFIGGLVGTVRNGGRMSDCFALGNVSAGTQAGGGLVGSGENVATIERSYAHNTVTAAAPRGVLGVNIVGPNMESSVVVDCYFAEELTATDPLATGLDATELGEQDSYVGFDFTAGTGVWTMNSEIQATPLLVRP